MVAYDSDIAPVAALLADRTRAAMLTALLDGRPLAAGELAMAAGVTAQTASSHLARLLDGGLVTVVRQGRHRYYQLAGADIAQAIEALSQISPPIEVRSLRQSKIAQALREARSCYDHLAGQAGVVLYAALCDNGLLDPESCDVTAKGEELFGEFGLDIARLRQARRRFADPCLDWTERRPHLSGALGAAIMARFIELGWFERGRIRRALILTADGARGLQDVFGCVLGTTSSRPDVRSVARTARITA
jgi:DNA-binding transcriptional ArsR family regulator